MHLLCEGSLMLERFVFSWFVICEFVLCSKHLITLVTLISKHIGEVVRLYMVSCIITGSVGKFVTKSAVELVVICALLHKLEKFTWILECIAWHETETLNKLSSLHWSMSFMFVLLQSSFRRETIVTKFTVVHKRVRKMFALYMVPNIRLAQVEEIFADSANISSPGDIWLVLLNILHQLTGVLESLPWQGKIVQSFDRF